MRRIFCFWFGPEMSEDRKRCYDSIVDNSGVDVVLVTDENLDSFIGTPLHDGFDCLSATHKADYLRMYFMYEHGGGYTDIKSCNYDWNPYFDALETSSKEFIGYSEKDENGVSVDCPEARKNWEKMMGVCHFIFKPDSSFASMWRDRVHAKMDQVLDKLKQYPGDYHQRAVNGGIGGRTTPEDLTYLKTVDRKKFNYPFKWSEILGQLVHNLQNENQHLYINGMPFVNTKDYR